MEWQQQFADKNRQKNNRKAKKYKMGQFKTKNGKKFLIVAK